MTVEVVSDYVYLGVLFNFNNSFTKAIDRQLTLGRKALFSMLTKIQPLNLPIDLQLSLFDKLVVPVLTYGCEVWGYSNLSKIELFHRKFLKNLLKISRYTANPMTYGETGRTSLDCLIFSRMLSFWFRLKHGNPNKISTTVFNLAKTMFNSNSFQSKWCMKISEVLNNLGLSYFWNAENINYRVFKKEIKQKLQDINMQTWSSQLTDNRLCINYMIFKTELKMEPFLTILDDQLRILFSKFRCGNHHLPISMQRFELIDERNSCPFGCLDVGDEYHFVLVCPAFMSYRELYTLPKKETNKPLYGYSKVTQIEPLYGYLHA